MQYLGGKHRQARTIVEHMARYTDRRLLIEPFCGACNVTVEAARQGFEVRASDSHLALITMWRTLATGWRPEIAECDEATYAAAKLLPDTDPLKALIGFGCGFGGKYFGGYARGGTTNYFDTAARGAVRKADAMGQHVRFECQDYDVIQVPDGGAIYCDPPYRSTTGYSTTKFDSDRFWTWCREQSEHSPVFVTEFDVPTDAQVLHEFVRPARLDNVSGSAKPLTIEKLIVFDRTR